MGHQCSTLGVCPGCESDIPRRGLFIENRHDGWPKMFADCLSCGGAVHSR